MLKIKPLLATSILMLATLACNTLVPVSDSNPAPTQTIGPTSSLDDKLPLTEAEVPRVTLEDAKAALDSNAAVFVDVRSRQAYDISHIAGAINIQLGEIETNPAGLNLDKDQWIITYCT